MEKKLKVKTELHLGSEFEHTRFVGEDGQMVDPFVPAFDIMKVKDLTQKKRESQKIKSIHLNKFYLKYYFFNEIKLTYKIIY